MYLSAVSSIASRVVLPPGKRTRLSFSLPYHHSLIKGCLGNVNPVFIEQFQELLGSPPMEVVGVGKNRKCPGLGTHTQWECCQRIWTQCWQQLLRRQRQRPRWSQTEGLLLLFLWTLALVAPGCCQGAARGTELELGSGWGLVPATTLGPRWRAACRAWASRMPAQSWASPRPVWGLDSEAWIEACWYSKTGEL